MFKLPQLLFLAVCFFSTNAFALIAANVVSYTIDKGTAATTPARCFSNSCETATATLSGSFDATIFGDIIIISNSTVGTSAPIGFSLPSQPLDSSGGTTRTASFSTDGDTLTLSGTVDSRAFDGPLQKYRLVATKTASIGFDAKGYFTARRDFRKCVSPLCGGIFVKSVNKRRTRCADGKRRRECYVGDLNWSAIGINPFGERGDLNVHTPLLLKGTIAPKKSVGFGNLGVFNAEAAYKPVSNNPPRGVFTALENNGIYCVTTPCFNTQAYRLNRKRSGTLSGFDLNPAGADQGSTEAAYALYGRGQALIVVGRTKREQELNGTGLSFYANQFYLPIKAKVACPKGYASVNGQCATKYGCIAPQLELMMIGGAAMIDPLTGEAVANTTYSCVDSCEFPAQRIGPARCSLALP